MAKRQWSRAFTPRTAGAQINISGVPPTLRQKFSAKCKREGRSQRNLLLGWVRNWVAGRRPDEERTSRAVTPEEEVAVEEQVV